MKLMTRLHLILAATMAVATLNVWAAIPPDTANTELLKRGQYLAAAGDCIACHTAPKGKPYAGGLPLGTPLGDIISTNITPSKTAGIGTYTLEQFTAAMRRGVRADGQHLYPAMPYTSYAQVSDADMQAMYAYFMHGVEPVDVAPPATSLPFPFNIRLSMAGWNLLFLDKKPFQPIPEKGDVWNRGAYLTRGLAHCSACHTPRNMLMAEDVSRELGGGEVGAWFAPNITSDANSGIGGWSDQEIVEYLKLGHTAKSQAAGPMAEAIDNSLRHLTDADLTAIAVYLKSVPGIHDPADASPLYALGAASDDLSSIRGVPLPKDLNQMTGPQLYDAHCATCHQARGQGSFDGGLPPLFHNTSTGRTNTNNLVMVMLDGVERHTDSAEVLMPGFRNVMSDQQIATLGNFLTKNFGNPDAQTTADQVKNLRAGGAPSNLVTLARVGIAVGIAIIILIAALFALRRRRRHR